MNRTKIQWTETTWNPVTGCTKISDGCKHCYAERMAKRLKAMGNERYKKGFKITVQEDLIDQPLRMVKPKMIFVNSMSDLFHDDVPEDLIIRIFETMNRANWHIFQILTKRPERMLELDNRGALNWTDNIWMGVTVESGKYYNRVVQLKKSHARTKFVSCEPLIDKVNFRSLNGIDWIIVGGESGPGCRPMKKEWVTNIRDKCEAAKIPFFFKQWGGFNKKKNGREIDGKTYDEYPEIYRIADRCT